VVRSPRFIRYEIKRLTGYQRGAAFSVNSRLSASTVLDYPRQPPSHHCASADARKPPVRGFCNHFRGVSLRF